MNKYNYNSVSQSWGTPDSIYKKLNDEFHFTHDPCPFPMPITDGLTSEWGDSNFCNPPFRDLKKWCKKCYEEYKKGKKVVLLMPCRSNSVYFHNYVLPYCDIRFVKGKVNFKNLDQSEDNSDGGGFKDPIIICIYGGSNKTDYMIQ